MILEQHAIQEEHRETHPEYHHLKRMKHEGIMTIRFASHSYCKASESSESLRKEFCELLMYNIRQKIKIRKSDWEWWGCSEFGKSGTGHCHIIFSFYPMELREKPLPKLNGFQSLALESAEYISRILGLPRKSIDIHWQPACDQGIVSYFCKKEQGHEDYKHFFGSRNSSGANKPIVERMIEGSPKEKSAQASVPKRQPETNTSEYHYFIFVACLTIYQYLLRLNASMIRFETYFRRMIESAIKACTEPEPSEKKSTARISIPNKNQEMPRHPAINVYNASHLRPIHQEKQEIQ